MKRGIFWWFQAEMNETPLTLGLCRRITQVLAFESCPPPHGGAKSSPFNKKGDGIGNRGLTRRSRQLVTANMPSLRAMFLAALRPTSLVHLLRAGTC
jgi:hypothetical protein